MDDTERGSLCVAWMGGLAEIEIVHFGERMSCNGPEGPMATGNQGNHAGL